MRDVSWTTGQTMDDEPLVLDHSIEADVSLAFAWKFRTDIATWNDPPATFLLDGPFAEGSRGTTLMPGQDPLPWWIRDVQTGRSFAKLSMERLPAWRSAIMRCAYDLGSKALKALRRRRKKSAYKPAPNSARSNWPSSASCLISQVRDGYAVPQRSFRHRVAGGLS